MTERKSSNVSISGQKRTVAEEPVTSVLRDGDVPVNETGHEWNADEEVLASLGYKPEFKREFTLWSTFCVSFAVLGLLPSFASTLYYGMGYAGTAGMTWGWLVAMIGIQSIASSMAELCSAMPTSGGLYYAGYRFCGRNEILNFMLTGSQYVCLVCYGKLGLSQWLLLLTSSLLILKCRRQNST